MRKSKYEQICQHNQHWCKDMQYKCSTYGKQCANPMNEAFKIIYRRIQAYAWKRELYFEASVALLWNKTPVFLTGRRRLYDFHPWSRHVVCSLPKASRPSPLHGVIKTIPNVTGEEPEAAQAEIVPVLRFRGCTDFTLQQKKKNLPSSVLVHVSWFFVFMLVRVPASQCCQVCDPVSVFSCFLFYFVKSFSLVICA